MPTDSAKFKELIYGLVALIPRGRVASYGQLAWLAGFPRRSRMVGRLMAEAQPELKLPCHRVVNSAGRTVPGWTEQAVLLRREKVKFRPSGMVDMDRCQWDGIDGLAATGRLAEFDF